MAFRLTTTLPLSNFPPTIGENSPDGRTCRFRPKPQRSDLSEIGRVAGTEQTGRAVFRHPARAVLHHLVTAELCGKRGGARQCPDKSLPAREGFMRFGKVGKFAHLAPAKRCKFASHPAVRSAGIPAVSTPERRCIGTPRAGRASGIDVAVSGDSQTTVYAAKTRKTQNQGVALREILLPNRRQRQQV